MPQVPETATTTTSKRPLLEKASWVAGILGVLLAAYAFWSSDTPAVEQPDRKKAMADRPEAPPTPELRLSSTHVAQGEAMLKQEFEPYLGARFVSYRDGSIRFRAYGCEYDGGRTVSLPVDRKLPDTPEVLLGFFALYMKRSFEREGGGVFDYQVYLINGREIGPDRIRPIDLSCEDLTTVSVANQNPLLVIFGRLDANGRSTGDQFLMSKN